MRSGFFKSLCLMDRQALVVTSWRILDTPEAGLCIDALNQLLKPNHPDAASGDCRNSPNGNEGKHRIVPHMLRHAHQHHSHVTFAEVCAMLARRADCELAPAKNVMFRKKPLLY